MFPEVVVERARFDAVAFNKMDPEVSVPIVILLAVLYQLLAAADCKVMAAPLELPIFVTPLPLSLIFTVPRAVMLARVANPVTPNVPPIDPLPVVVYVPAALIDQGVPPFKARLAPAVAVPMVIAFTALAVPMFIPPVEPESIVIAPVVPEVMFKAEAAAEESVTAPALV